MQFQNYWLKYLYPFIGLLFCPIIILFIWTIWNGPVINSTPDFIEDIEP